MIPMKAKDIMTVARKVEFVYHDITIGEAIDKMARNRYTMIPVLERNSMRYLYSLSSSDILRKVMADNNPAVTREALLSSISVQRFIVPCAQSTDINDLTDLVINQNYVPLVDEKGVFQGIVTRRAIINYLLSSMEGE